MPQTQLKLSDTGNPLSAEALNRLQVSWRACRAYAYEPASTAGWPLIFKICRWFSYHYGKD